jgi:hypothetical protein
MRANLLSMACLLLAVVVSACTSSGTLKLEHARTETIPPGRSVALWVKPTVANDASEEARKEASEVADRLKNELFSRLVSEGIFSYVFQPGEPADYRLNVAVTQAEEVSQTARFWLGALAGRNELDAAVALYDEASGNLLTDFEVMGESARVLSRNDIEDAVHEAADKIISGLQGGSYASSGTE